MKNRFNVDVDYFKKEFNQLLLKVDNQTPEELERYLICLSKVAKIENNSIIKTYNKIKKIIFNDNIVIIIILIYVLLLFNDFNHKAILNSKVECWKFGEVFSDGVIIGVEICSDSLPKEPSNVKCKISYVKP